MPINRESIDALCLRLRREAESGGYHLNPDEEFVKELIEGILINEERYGYRSCPCRLASGDKFEDLDIICPCDYRDPDILEHNACYCALYVSQKILSGKATVTSIPERRPAHEKRRHLRASGQSAGLSGLPFPVWRCRVCGYLCAREEPPETCPVCKAKKERFERFL